MHRFEIATGPAFSLAETVAPVAWGGGRWPNQDWHDCKLVAVATEHGSTCIRIVSQIGSRPCLLLETNRPELDNQGWAEGILGVHRHMPEIDEPVIRELAGRFPGMRPFSNGDLFDGIVTAIIGQSISVQAAAVTERKLAALFADPIEVGHRAYWPAPSIEQLASAEPDLLRQAGMTQRRADAIVRIARIARENQFSPRGIEQCDEAALIESLMQFPQVGRWTAESVLLWGLGADDAYPTRDVALLRAARLAYGRPELTHAGLDELSDHWRPGRSWAARLLWLNLFGPAPERSPNN